MTRMRTEKIPVHSLLYKRKLCSRLLKELRRQASGGGQTSSLLRVRSLVFELIQCTLWSATTINVSG